MRLMWQLITAPFWAVVIILHLIVTILHWVAQRVLGWFTVHKGPDTHGDAEWATAKQLKDKGHFQPVGWYVGVMDDKRVYTHPESSVIVVAPKRQGKSRNMTAAIRDIARHKRQTDLLIGDATGDLERENADMLRQAGYEVWTIDLVNPTASKTTYNAINILEPFSVNDYERDVDAFCRAIMADDVRTNEEHFMNSARNTFKALVMAMYEEDQDITLYDVVEMATADQEKLRKYFEGIRHNTRLVVKQALGAYFAAGDKERGSFVTTMSRKLEVWGRTTTRLILKPHVDTQTGVITDWRFEDVFNNPKPHVIFIRSGLGTDEGAVARLIFSNAINTKRRQLNRHGPACIKALGLMADEAVTFGNCEAFMYANNELGKMQVTTYLAYLSLEQIKSVYKLWETLVTNSEIIAFGGGKEMGIYDLLSKLFGDKTVESGSRQENGHGESKGLSEQARRLAKPEEIAKLPFNQCVMKLGQLNVKCGKAGNKL